MLLIVGLGNPDREYADNRHNVGWMVIDLLAALTSAEPFRKRFSGEIARCAIGGKEAMLLKPLTFMNLSGDSVQPCSAYFKVAPADIVVVHDEIDLPFGVTRIKQAGGHAGHNGVRSVIARLGTGEFARVRFGIGRPPADFKGDEASFVLRGFTAEEKAQLPDLLKIAAESVLDIAARGLPAAMNTRNTRERKQPKPENPGKD